jgi:hypothetical protein
MDIIARKPVGIEHLGCHGRLQLYRAWNNNVRVWSVKQQIMFVQAQGDKANMALGTMTRMLTAYDRQQ